MYPKASNINEVEFSVAIGKLEKRLLQFWAGNLYLVGNRNLHEFTLTLKDYSRATDILESP